MIIDSLNNASQYTSMHPLFAKAFDYLQQNNPDGLPDGTVEIEEGLKMIVSSKPGKTREESLTKFEGHDKNIDIQVCVNGPETIAWKPREKCILPKGEYRPEKDVQFFADDPDMFFQLASRQFVIFFPQDIHAPMIGKGELKKIVFKVKI